jgi:cation transporter-like permease
MSRIGRGWILTKESWAIIRRDRTLLVFPIVAGISGLLVGAVFIGGGVGLRAATGSEPVMIVAFVIGAYVLTVVSTFCNVALTSCAARALDGEDTTVAEGFAAARERFGVVMSWS